MRVPLIGASESLSNRQASVERTINLIPVPVESPQARSPWVFEDAPGLAIISAQPTGPVECDFWLRLEFEDAQPNVDTSKHAHPITNWGNPTVSSAWAYDGKQSMLVNGSEQYLIVNNNVPLSLGTGNWAIRTVIRPTANVYGTIFMFDGAAAGQLPNIVQRWPDGACYFYLSNTAAIGQTANTGPGLLPLNESSEVVLQRRAGVYELWINGMLRLSSTGALNTGSAAIHGSSLKIGGAPAYSDFAGYIDRFTICPDEHLQPDNLPLPVADGPIRGLSTFGGILHGVAGDSLFRMDSAGARTWLATLNSTGGQVDFTANISQLAIADGSYLYVWDGATLRALNEAQGYVPGDRIGMVDQRVAGIQRSSQRFAWSALGDAGSWGALDFASAEAVPDNLVSMAVVYGELLLLGEFSGEIWQSVGGETIFQRNGSAYLEWGCAAAFSLRKCGPSAIWLGRNEHGQAAVLQLQGYQATPVSTRAIEERFEGRDLSGASAFVMLDGKQEFYCLNVPGIDTTLVYSTLTKRWHERAELVAGNWQPWRATCHAFAYGQHYVGAADGNIYRLDRDAHDYAGAPKVRSRIVPVISKPDRGRVVYGPLEVVCAKATGGQLLVRWSNDNGSTWSDWETVGAGLVGEHWQRVRLNRLGSGYDRVLELRMADAAPFDPVDAWLEAA